MKASYSLAVIWCATMIGVAGQSPPVRPHEVWTAPAAEAAKANPLANVPENGAGGRKLFHQRCSACHGEDARGTNRGPDLTDESVQRQSDGALFWKISSGNTRAGMPSFSFLPGPQRWQLVLHVRAHASRDPDKSTRGQVLRLH